MKTIKGKRMALRAITRRGGLHWRRLPIVRCSAGFTAAIAVVVLGGCQGTMPAPVGLTAAPGSAVVYNAASPFSVGIVANRAPPLRIGDELGFTLSASATGYGHLYLLNASGAVLVLAENVSIAGGAQAAFPTPGGGFTFRASPPAGVERVLFLVTRQPLAGFGGGARAPVQLPVKAQAFITDLNAATRQLPRRDWAMAETRIEIVPADG